MSETQKKPAKTRPADEVPTPIGEAAAELDGEELPDIVMTFRRQEFRIPRARLLSWKFKKVMDRYQQKPADHTGELIDALLGSAQSTMCEALIGEDEPFADVATEFVAAFNEASGPGNSSAS